MSFAKCTNPFQTTAIIDSLLLLQLPEMNVKLSIRRKILKSNFLDDKDVYRMYEIKIICLMSRTRVCKNYAFDRTVLQPLPRRKFYEMVNNVKYEHNNEDTHQQPSFRKR